MYYAIAILDRVLIKPLHKRSKKTANLYDDWIMEIIRYTLDRGSILATFLIVAYVSKPWSYSDTFFDTVVPVLLGILILLIITDAI